MFFNGLSRKAYILDIFLNSASSSILRYNNASSFFSNMHGDFSLPWMPFQNQKTKNELHHSSWIYNMIVSFCGYNFETLQVDNASRSCISQWERPHKKYEHNYEDRGFWDSNSRNLSQQKVILAYSRHYINFV